MNIIEGYNYDGILGDRETTKEIIIHCTDTPRDGRIGVEDINLWHIRRGFSCIGYHYVIRADGEIERGRAEEKIGAHCLGHNRESIGICYVGGRDKFGRYADTRTERQKKAMHLLVKALKAKYPTITEVHGHNEYNKAKYCPCFDVRQELWEY